MAEVAEAHGVPRDHILCEDEARYTIENALFVRRMLERRSTSIVSVTIVTSAFHMERSKLIFGAVLIVVLLPVVWHLGNQLYESVSKRKVTTRWNHAVTRDSDANCQLLAPTTSLNQLLALRHAY